MDNTQFLLETELQLLDRNPKKYSQQVLPKLNN